MTYHCTQCGQTATQKKDNLFLCPAFHENWINPAIGSCVFVLDSDKVLYGTRNMGENSGKLDIPGGFVDLHESAEQAAIREVQEEMGITVELVDYLGSYPTTYYNDRPILNFVFIAKQTGGTFSLRDDMIGQPIWRDLHNLPTVEEAAWVWYMHAQKDLQAWWDKKHNQ